MKKTKTVKHNIPIKGEPPFLEQNDFIAPEDANHIAKLAFQKRGKELLKAARKEIRASASNGEYHTEMIIPGYDLAQYVFNILLSDGYELKIQSLSDRIGDERIGLSIDWSGPDSDTGKKMFYLWKIRKLGWEINFTPLRSVISGAQVLH